MALLQKSRVQDIPKDAVLLSEMEALKLQMDLIKKWDKPSEVFALRYGPYVLGCAAFISGAYFNNHFRRKFMLGHYGNLSSYLPVCIVPGAVSFMMHTELVLRRIVLMKFDECPLCLQVKAAALQSSMGVLFPLIVGPLGCAALAVRYATYNMPYLHEKPIEALKTFRSMFRKIQTKTLYMFLGQAFLGSAVAYFEANELLRMQEKLTPKNQETLND